MHTARHTAANATPWTTLAWRVTAAASVASLLVAGLTGGLLRAGVGVPLPAGATWPAAAVAAHAFLMMPAFLGTVIGFERAVACRARAAFAAPALSAAAGAAMLLGWNGAAGALAALSALAFVGVNAVLGARQPSAHMRLMLAGAGALLVGNLMLALRTPISAVAPWWFAFLVCTIAAERLEMARLMPPRPGAARLFGACIAGLLCGAAAFAPSPVVGGWLYGGSLLALAAWLLRHDIARRTVRARGLPRYMAICLLAGHAWLGVAGLAWMAAAAGLPARDAALHALGLGFVFSMVFGHAPVILPALARLKVAWGWPFYLPLAALHLSLAWRLSSRFGRFERLGEGALGNVLSLVFYAALLVAGALAWRWRHRTRKPHEHPAPR